MKNPYKTISSVVMFLRAPRTNDLIDPTRALRIPFSDRALTDLKFATRDISLRHYIFPFQSILSTLSRSILLSFSLAVVLTVILRLPTRVSRALSRVRARNETTVRKPLSKF